MCITSTFTRTGITGGIPVHGLKNKSKRSYLPSMILSGLLALSWCLAPQQLVAGETVREAEHTRRLAVQYDAQSEVVLWDKTRADLVGSTWVGEVDWAPKWAEGIGQALYYSIVMDRQPVLFLLTKRGEERFVYRAQTVCAKYKINLIVVWVQNDAQ